MTDFDYRDAVVGKDDTVAMMKKLLAMAERDEIQCGAMRVFKADGTFEDIAFGGTEEERDEALAKLRQQN